MVLWFLVGVAAGVLAWSALVPAATGATADLAPWAAALGPIAVLLFLCVVAVELGFGIRLVVLRWLVLGAALMVAGLAGSPYFAVLRAIAVPTGVTALVAAVVLLAFGTNKDDERGRPVAVGRLFGALANRPGNVWVRAAVAALVVGLVAGVGVAEAASAQSRSAVAAPVSPPATVEAVRIADPPAGDTAMLVFPSDPAAQNPGAEARLVLLIDGNRRDRVVLFDHAEHSRRLGEQDSCGTCHHLNRPLDRATSCSVCHRSMRGEPHPFGHADHVAALNGNASCRECHATSDALAEGVATKPCRGCHAPEGGEAKLKWPVRESVVPVPSYELALHTLCIRCHVSVEVRERREQPSLTLCTNCHRYTGGRKPMTRLEQFGSDDLALPAGWLVLPPVGL